MQDKVTVRYKYAFSSAFDIEGHQFSDLVFKTIIKKTSHITEIRCKIIGVVLSHPVDAVWKC